MPICFLRRFRTSGPVLLFLLCLAQFPCDGKLIPRRDPLDAALDSTLILLMRQQSQDTFVAEEVFLGAEEIGKGETLALPGFALVVEDKSRFVSGRERTEPIRPGTRILVFLKPATANPTGYQPPGKWSVAGYGNCYFWSHDPNDLDDLRAKAKQALALRAAWQNANNLKNTHKRVEALWPFLWSHNRSCYSRTEATLIEIGAIAGDYFARRLPSMPSDQKKVNLINAGRYKSSRLHYELIRELQRQMHRWELLLARRGGFATYPEVDRPGRIRTSPPRPEDAEATEAAEIYGVLYYGLTGLVGFEQRADLPFIRQAAIWGLKYRFNQMDDAALKGFTLMPARANLPVIASIWSTFSNPPNEGNELNPHQIIKALETHRYREAIPLMAQFVQAGFMQDVAHNFLVEMTGTDQGEDPQKWLAWYEANVEKMPNRK